MRYALYYSPDPASELWEIGCRWLGYDSFTQKKIKQEHFTGISPTCLYEFTRAPRRYGFHGTLKAPFRLAEGYSETDLQKAVEHFCELTPSFVFPPLVLSEVSDFFCLCPEKNTSELTDLAAGCVTKFDLFRAPLTRLELAGRRAEILDANEKENLSRWGYPYVLDKFHFHMSLTGRINNGPEKRVIRSILTRTFSAVIKKPVRFDAITLFVEPSSGHPFFCINRFPLRKSTQMAVDIPGAHLLAKPTVFA